MIDDLSISHREAVLSFLNVLKIKSPPTYEHSRRVALIATRIAEYCKLNPKPAFLSGCLHDVGKSLIPLSILHKQVAFSRLDMRVMKKHVLRSYEMVRDIFPFTAEIILRHHRWQKNPYPRLLPQSPINFSPNTKLLIDWYSRILALADFYDACNTRQNDKYQEKNKRQLLIEHNKDQEYLINNLYDDKILN